MARPKGSKRRPQAPAPASDTPLAHFKRAVALVKGWTAACSTDPPSLIAFATCIEQLQRQLGLAPAAADAPESSGAQAMEGAEVAAGGSCCDIALEARLLELLRPVGGYSACVAHSLDLDLDEPAFLLASAHLELGRLLQQRGAWADAEQHYGAALRLFPEYVAARLASAQALRARADSDAQLGRAEALLQEALAAAQAVSEAEGGLLPEASLACRREVEAGGAARGALAMLLCQAGRDEEAAQHLTALGFTHRLARQVLYYPLRPPSTTSSELQPALDADYCRYVQAVDGALPPALLAHLQTALAPDSRFWTEHGYGRVGYFSYMHTLSDPCVSSIHQLSQLLHAIVCRSFPAASEARYAEWWAHCRLHPSGHQLHFDSDDEGQGGVRNPIVSSVVYLTGGIGGPTLVTPQLLGGPLATRGWLVHPRENRLGMFDASHLHGVIPGRGPSPAPGQFRVTLMVAFWRDIKCRPRDDGLPGPSQPYPQPGSSRYTWMDLLQPHPGGPQAWGSSSPVPVEPIQLGEVWAPVGGNGRGQPGGEVGAVPYDACFQGF